MDHLVLIDGHHMLYRAYWAIPRTLKNKKGEQTNIAFGMASMLLSILRIEQPTHLLLAFDAGSDTFRHKEHEAYKEGRAETPDDFHPQIPGVLGMLEQGGFPMVSDPKFEADDFLGVYARAADAAGMKVTIVTGDRDAFQLANGNIRIAIPHKGYEAAEYLGAQEVYAKLGVRPDQIPDYKGLCGDSSDNLPGVKGIGPKGAAQLLQQFETLAALYENLDKVSATTRAKLEHDREQAFFCARMATLVADIPLPFSLEQLRLQNLPTAELFSAFEERDFTALRRRLLTISETPYGKTVFTPMVQKTEEESQLAMF